MPDTFNEHRLIVGIPPDIKKALDTCAANSGVTKSEIVRRLLANHLLGEKNALPTPK